MCQRALEDSGLFVLSERRCTGSEQPEYPPRSLMLVTVNDVCSNGLNVVHTDDTSADQPQVVGLEELLRWKLLLNPASICAPHGATSGGPIRGLCLRRVTPQSSSTPFCGVTWLFRDRLARDRDTGLERGSSRTYSVLRRGIQKVGQNGYEYRERIGRSVWLLERAAFLSESCSASRSGINS
ncbi:MAG: hypothetical protein J07HQW2_03806 [Haloquadratum walsbyi J07HQW2]|uniref:Uncharacterized protein n=1 Tax=Haloquadratum walsbyi J07HQW2 TaxID=1238425 RepID=U1NJA9_9EURY|nr:MAG: hypothetical protein J07HQW2_03806 [Haloquadratum walsbyi J07HQW2]